MIKSERLKRLWFFVSPYRTRLWIASFHSVVNQLMDLAPPLLIGLAVDSVVKKDQSFLAASFPNPIHQLWLLGVLTLLIWGLESLFEYWYKYAWKTLAQRIQHQVRQTLYTHVHDLDAHWFSDQKTGDLMAAMNDDINQLERFLNVGANHLLQVTTTTLTVSAVFFYISPPVALWAMLPIPLILWGSFRFQRAIGPRYFKVRNASAYLNTQMAHTLKGMEVVKSFGQEEKEIKRLETLSLKYAQANEGAIRLSSAFSPLIRMAVVLGFLSTLIYGGQLTLQGQIEVGSYSVLVFLTQRLLWPLTRLGETVDLLQRALASVQRVMRILDTPKQQHTGDYLFEDQNFKGELQFQNLSFAYPQFDPLFTDLNLMIPAHQTTAIVGATGSGKSSLSRLILGFYKPQEGHVLIDQVPLEDLDLKAWRHKVGLVSQHVYLFDGTLYDNLKYGSEEATEEWVLTCAHRAGVDEFVDRFPNRYQTQVGEGGLKLSGGQKQRVSIARALIKSPQFLILDEATSAIDPYMELFIHTQLNEHYPQTTCLIIAHRLNTIRSADQIIVLDQGKVIESGTHHHLLEQQGKYAQLWNLQSAQDEL